jgi:energy-coupling factor transporter ATP-binding protein EcfA2
LSDSTKIFQTYLRRLTNLSGTNRSLLLLRLASEQVLDLHQFSFLNNEKSFEIIKALIAGKSKKICPLLDSRMEAANEASRKLKRLQRVDKFIFEERGSTDLHVGWPMIRGKFMDGTVVRCPLLYFPVQLDQDTNQWILSVRKDAGITFNKSFLLAYSFYNKLKLDDDLLDTNFDDFDEDSIAFRTQLYELLKTKVELNFNSDTFTDDLIPFQEFKKGEFENLQKEGELKLYPEAVLGIFPQAGSQLVPDYLNLIDEQPFETLEDFFIPHIKNFKKNSDQWISAVKEENIYSPFPLDAYQEHALRTIKNGNSLVVQGPPGTGKSQLISNLIADAIASGRKVLLVCQKRVALDVVYDRLKKIKLGDFLGLVHDFRNDRKEIYDKIARQVDSIEAYQARNRNIDVIQLERRFFQVSRRTDQLTETLEEFRTDLFDDKDCGVSAKELYLTSNPNQPTINLRQEFRHFHFSIVNDVVTKLKRYTQYASILESENHRWLKRKSFSAFQVGDLRLIEKVVEDIPSFQKQINEELNKILALSLNLEECESLLHRQQQAEEMLGLISNETIFGYFKAMVEEKDDETSLLWLQNMERVTLNCFDGVSVEATLAMPQLMQCRDALQNRMKARKNVFKMIRWELFSEHKFFLKRVLISNQLEYTKQGLLTLEQRIDNRLNLEHHLTSLKKKNWLISLPVIYQHSVLREWFAEQLDALRAKLIFNELREINNSIHPQKFSIVEFQSAIRSVFTIISTIPFHRNDWQHYLSPYQIKQLILEPELAADYINSIRRDFDLLCEYDTLKESLNLDETDVVNKLLILRNVGMPLNLKRFSRIAYA